MIYGMWALSLFNSECSGLDFSTITQQINDHKMSISFVSDKPIDFDEIKAFDFMGAKVDEVTEDGSVILTDGTNYLWAGLLDKTDLTRFGSDKLNPKHSSLYGYVEFTRYAGNRAEKLILAIETFFKVTLISEYEEMYFKIITEPDYE